MSSRDVLKRLENENPYPLMEQKPRRRGRGVLRLSAIAISGVLMLSGAAAGYTYVSSQPNVVTTWSGTAITGPAAADNAVINVHDQSVVTMIDAMAERFPLPPGVPAAKAYSVLETSFPLAQGADWPQLSADGPTDPYFINVGYISSGGDNPLPEYVNARDLAGTVALLSANAWYQYWLTGNAGQRAEAAAVVAQTPQWTDLVRRVEGGNVERSRIVKNNAHAVAQGDAAQIRDWFARYRWNPLGFG